MSSDNPLKQYFRRPAVYLKLPSNGIYYGPGVVDIPESGELPIYPMTAIDEISARTPDALFNGTAVIDIIKSCVPNIKDPWKINNIDLDAILIAIKNASGDGKLPIDSTCDKCQESSSYDVNLMGILSQIKPGDYKTPLKINDLKVKFRPLTYTEINKSAISQFELQRQFSMLDNIQDENERTTKIKEALLHITELTMEIIAEGIEYIETPSITVDNKEFIIDFMKNCNKDIYVSIRDHSTDLKDTAQIKPLHIKCHNCGHEYDQNFTLNASNFFE